MGRKVKTIGIYSYWSVAILRNIEKYWEILRNIEKYWEILRNIEKYWDILRNSIISEKLEGMAEHYKLHAWMWLAREESCKKRLEIQKYCLTGSKTYITFIFREKEKLPWKNRHRPSWAGGIMDGFSHCQSCTMFHGGKRRVVRKWSTPKYPKISWLIKFMIIFPIQLSRLGYPMVFSPPSTKIIERWSSNARRSGEVQP